VGWGFYYAAIGNGGTVYNLSRCIRGLGRYVRYEVELTDIPTLITLDTTVIHAASTVQELPALEVKAVRNYRRIAACRTGERPESNVAMLKSSGLLKASFLWGRPSFGFAETNGKAHFCH
jgi:hypothetical protein